MIPDKGEYMDFETWVKVVKVVASSIRKMKVNNDACVFPILLSIDLTLHLYPSKLSANDI